jgi:hypothetical protein
MPTKIQTLSASELLLITQPEKLYSLANCKTEYRSLCSIWHPDRNKNIKATEVFQHIKMLFEQTEVKIKSGTWNGPSDLTFTTHKGKTYKFHYKCYQEFDLGKMYIGATKLMYVVDAEFKDLFDNGVNMINSIVYPNSAYEDQFKRHFPVVLFNGETDIGLVLVVEKTLDLILLKDLLDVMGGKLPMVHTAWVLSTLSNIACFLEMNKIAHGALSIDTLWISPMYHSAVVLGGWWYARKDGDKLLALPSSTLSILPSSVLVDKKAKSSYDRQLIKSIALESLGDKTRIGSMLLTDKSVPNNILMWLRGSGEKSAVEDYKAWSKVRDAGLGPRKFVALDIDIHKIY